MVLTATFLQWLVGQESSPSILVAFDDSDQCDTAEDACTGNSFLVLKMVPSNIAAVNMTHNSFDDVSG
eukprot:m.61774 g.61774  ORF g.61774 m.61774 type:complete len:68 (+) comp11879_c0_seq2:2672-2875(+)